VFDQVTIKKVGFYHDYYIINDAKMTLRSILMGFNCRLFQSFGRWYIVNNSSYGDQRIIAGIQAGTYVGSGILTAKQGFLNGGSEEIKYWIYNASGVAQTAVTTNMLKVVPTNMQPIGQNLFRTPRRPVKKYQEIGIPHSGPLEHLSQTHLQAVRRLNSQVQVHWVYIKQNYSAQGQEMP
jgi:hypothetical protein